MPVWHRQIIQYLTLCQWQRSHQGETLFVNSQFWISVETTRHFVQEEDREKKKMKSNEPALDQRAEIRKVQFLAEGSPDKATCDPHPRNQFKSQLSISPRGWNSCWGQSGCFSLFAGLSVNCCFMSTETIDLLGTGAQDGHFDFHTAPELWSAGLCPLSLKLSGSYHVFLINGITLLKNWV